MNMKKFNRPLIAAAGSLQERLEAAHALNAIQHEERQRMATQSALGDHKAANYWHKECKTAVKRLRETEHLWQSDMNRRIDLESQVKALEDDHKNNTQLVVIVGSIVTVAAGLGLNGLSWGLYASNAADWAQWATSVPSGILIAIGMGVPLLYCLLQNGDEISR
jgi:hypothetical protein